jgi:hypothetical protein
VAVLSASLSALVAESQALRSDVLAAEQARKRANRIALSLLAVLCLFTGAVLAIGWQNNQLSRRVDKTNNQMADCTTPGGVCYEDGRRRTEGAVSSVVRISLFVSQCGRLHPGESGPEYDQKMEKCVTDRLAAAAAADRATPAPSPGG